MSHFRNTGQPDWDWWSELWADPNATLRRLGIESGRSVADVCSGNGFFTLPAARIADSAPVFAVELDADLLSDLRREATKRGIDNVRPSGATPESSRRPFCKRSTWSSTRTRFTASETDRRSSTR